MKKLTQMFSPAAAVLLALLFSSAALSGATVTTGAVSFDPADMTGAAGSFDVFNGTGANSSIFPDELFPVATPLVFADLSLTVRFSSGLVETLDSTHFTPDGTGGFIGNDIFDVNSIISSATFSGSAAPTNTALQLNDGSELQITDPGWSTTLAPTSGNTSLQLGDFALIEVPSSPVPEPSGRWFVGGAITVLLLACGMKFSHRHLR